MPFSTSESWQRKLDVVLLDLEDLIVAKFTKYTLPIPHGLLFPYWLTKLSPRLLITYFNEIIRFLIIKRSKAIYWESRNTLEENKGQ